MAELYEIMKQKLKYYDKKNYNTQQQYEQALRESMTVYVGNLPLDVSMDSIKELFDRAGHVQKIVMGINNQGLRCGFCFVIYENHAAAQLAVQYISQTKLNEKIIRVDMDPGYAQGRQKGRGKDGNQKRDDLRNRNYDNRRGGYQGRSYDRNREGGGYNRDGGSYNRQGGYNRYDRNERYDRGAGRSYNKDRYSRNQGGNEEQNNEGAPRRRDRKQYEQPEAPRPQQKKSDEQY